MGRDIFATVNFLEKAWAIIYHGCINGYSVHDSAPTMTYNGCITTIRAISDICALALGAVP